jgi:hypothetical protein
MIVAGDKCWVQTTKKHYGVCTGHGPDGELWFVHNTREAGVVHTTHKGFAGNRPVYVEQRAEPSQAPEVVARAYSLVGSNYDLLSFNCEHVANLAANGSASSPQVQFAVTGILASVAFLALLNQNGTSVDRQGFRRDNHGRFASRRWL